MIPTSCPSCSSLPLLIHPLPFGKPYLSHVSRTQVIPQLDDFRCRWCSTQWSERERDSLTGLRNSPRNPNREVQMARHNPTSKHASRKAKLATAPAGSESEQGAMSDAEDSEKDVPSIVTRGKGLAAGGKTGPTNITKKQPKTGTATHGKAKAF